MSKRSTVLVLPKALAHWRKVHLHWTQEDLARRASATPTAKRQGISVSTSAVAMIEGGKRQPSEEVAEVLAEAMEVEVTAFAFLLPEDPAVIQAASTIAVMAADTMPRRRSAEPVAS